jgi:hypothetical protein
LKICDYLKKEIESNEKYIKLLKIELKQVIRISVNVKHEHKKLDEYEKIYDGELDKLIDKIEVQIDIDKFDKKRFNWSLFLSIVSGLVGGFITGYFLFRLGFT